MGTTCYPRTLIHENLYIYVHVILVYAIHGNRVLTSHYHPWKLVHPCPCEPRATSTIGNLLLGIFQDLLCGFMGLPCAMYTCVNSKYTHSVLAPTVKRTVPTLFAKGTLIIEQPCCSTSWALVHHPWELRAWPHTLIHGNLVRPPLWELYTASCVFDLDNFASHNYELWL